MQNGNNKKNISYKNVNQEDFGLRFLFARKIIKHKISPPFYKNIVIEFGDSNHVKLN